MVRQTTQHALPMYEPAKTIRCVGFLDKTDSIPVKTDGRWNADPVIEKIVKTRATDYDPLAFGIASPSHQNVLKSFEKYDRIDVWPEMPLAVRLEEEVQPAVQEFYANLWRQCKVITLDECLYVPDTSPGPIIKSMGYSTKLQARKALYSYFKWYTDFGFMDAPPPLYKQNGKIELLKASKMANGVSGIRGFTVPPMEELLLQSRYMQDANLKIDEMGQDLTSDCYSLVGANLREGGFVRLFDVMRHNAQDGGKVWKGDVTRMDACESQFLLNGCMSFRKQLFDRKSSVVQTFDAAMEHIYENMLCTYVLMPNGQILQKETGMPSGALPTSNDGTYCHEQALAWHWLRVTDRPVSQMPLHVKGKLYCDDHLCSVDAQFEHVADFQERNKSYSQLGLILNPEDDEVSDTLEGMSLLGFECKNGKPVPARRQKFYHGLARPDGPRDVSTTLQRAIAFMDNAAYEDDLFALARTVAQSAVDRGAKWLYSGESDWMHIPSQRECQRRWEGLESSSKLHHWKFSNNETFGGPNNL